MSSPSKIRSDGQRPSPLKLEISRPAETADDDSGGEDDRGRLLGDSAGDDEDGNERLLNARSVYMDSPRGGVPDESDLSPDEITRRRRVGWAAVSGLMLSVLTCVMLLHVLEHQDAFRCVCMARMSRLTDEAK